MDWLAYNDFLKKEAHRQQLKAYGNLSDDEAFKRAQEAYNKLSEPDPIVRECRRCQMTTDIGHGGPCDTDGDLPLRG